jgi:hypothetical protein
MIREAMVFHYLDDLDSKLAAVRVALASPSGDEEWSAYSGALGRKFLKLDEFLKPAAIPTETEAQPVTKQAAASSSATTAQSPAPASKPKQETGFLRKLFS